MIVAGIMSGTSADGVDVAICRISAGSHTEALPRLKVLGHRSFPYPAPVRAAVLRAMDGDPLSAAELSKLSWRLGAIYAECVAATAQDMSLKLDLAGCHGQTIYHQPAEARFLGADVRCTCQIGEASLLAERQRCPVVSDFRPADLAAGGQGAPLVPILDFSLFGSRRVSRVLLNLGGIANLTAIPAGTGVEDVLAFDTGPANMIVDGCMSLLYRKAFDRGGAVAGRGKVLRNVVDTALQGGYFSALPPKSCGREQFGSTFLTRWIDDCRVAGGKDADIVATATALTVQSVADAYAKFVWAHLGQLAPEAKTELIVAGGGAENTTLMAMLRASFVSLGVRVRTMDELGIHPQAKEAVAFALLAWRTWCGLPGNIVSATGAKRRVILGKVTFV